MLKALSLFSGAGIGETYESEADIKTVVANELIAKRAEIYKYRFPDVNMIIGDIKENKKKIIEASKQEQIDMIIATPPCQGMSSAGKRNYETDKRNFLIFDVLNIVDDLLPKYVFIENVPKFLKMEYFDKNGELKSITNILKEKYFGIYNIKFGVYDAADYGVPQHRKRTIIRMFKKGLEWNEPEKQKHITVKEAIGHLPSLESGEASNLKYHIAPVCTEKHILWLKHTPTGKSAFENPVYYPQKENGEKIKAFANTYKRISWDKPCPTRTMNYRISGSNNVHPGRLKPDGTYSDARPLTLLELLIVSSLPENINFPEGTTEKTIRDVIGEGIPPKMSLAFFKKIGKI